MARRAPARTVSAPRQSAADVESAAAAASRLVPVVWVVVAGTPETPTGSLMTSMEDPGRLQSLGVAAPAGPLAAAA